MRIKISARSSHLARLQAYQVGAALEKANSNIQIEYFFRESLGDKNLTDPLWKMPEKGVFTEDFYQDLIEEKTDLIVHSWKDLPTERKPDTFICGTLPRADQRDVLLFKKSSLVKMQHQTKEIQIFSSSQRRIYNLQNFLLKALPYQPEKIDFLNIRGNIPTRIEKLAQAENVDGLILAKAALDRLLSVSKDDLDEAKIKIRNYLKDFEFMVLPLSANPNAAAQGALAIEVKSSRLDIIEFIKQLNDSKTFLSADTERQILSSHGGGCHQKIGIAVLQRDYGQISFLKGLTDQGVVLDSDELKLNSDLPILKKNLKKCILSTYKNLFQRESIEYVIPENINALFVSRVTAYRPFQGYIWVSGLETWKQLAEKNVWVHGSSESLGEQEDPQIEILAGAQLNWAKLTHQDAESSDILSIPTYKLQLKGDLPQEALEAESFFWMSAYQFDILTAKYPQLLNKYHCCGVGQTYKALKKRLALLNKQPYLFLNEKQWRQYE